MMTDNHRIIILVLRRAVVVAILLAFVAAYFGFFLLTEGDAYGTPGHPMDGYIHAPWIVGMPISLILGFASAATLERIWGKNKRRKGRKI